MDMKSIGERIREHRIARNWRQEDLAEHANLSSAYIGMIERGEKIPKLQTFIEIANVLHVSADELLSGVLVDGYADRMYKYSERISRLSRENQKLLCEITEVFLKNNTEKSSSGKGV